MHTFYIFNIIFKKIIQQPLNAIFIASVNLSLSSSVNTTMSVLENKNTRPSLEVNISCVQI